MLDSSQSTAYHIQTLMSQKIPSGNEDEQQNQSQPQASSSNALDVQRNQLLAQSNMAEAELQRETEGLIQQMREEASNGTLPEYGKKIIDVLINYQGKI